MSQLEPRVKRLEAKMLISERRAKIGEFGYATPSEIRELLAAIEAKGPAFEIRRNVEGKLDQQDAALEELKNGKP